MKHALCGLSNLAHASVSCGDGGWSGSAMAISLPIPPRTQGRIHQSDWHATHHPAHRVTLFLPFAVWLMLLQCPSTGQAMLRVIPVDILTGIPSAQHCECEEELARVHTLPLSGQ